MKMLTSKLKIGLLHVMALAIVACGLFAGYQTFNLQTADNAIKLQQSTIANQKLEIDGLASEVAYLGTEVETMKSQAELVAAINSEHERQTIAITDTGNDWQANSNKLQVSEHEPTRTWTATALPDDALRLLNDASRSQNGHSQTTSLRPAAFKHDGLWLSATTI
ncbi:MAG TPA: hypothetical protein DF774_02235 [Rheinheimera sp.]|uniref:hypothetical protein n=1 Tax=Rheinheimera sp. TaxID=1869214 RepID=UPI000EC71173|nr:hypothetical protein [Rheinheimera sp.]HCU64559.1 hypothetical protein [Rheinheimera sp.]